MYVIYNIYVYMCNMYIYIYIYIYIYKYRYIVWTLSIITSFILTNVIN